MVRLIDIAEDKKIIIINNLVIKILFELFLKISNINKVLSIKLSYLTISLKDSWPIGNEFL